MTPYVTPAPCQPTLVFPDLLSARALAPRLFRTSVAHPGLKVSGSLLA